MSAVERFRSSPEWPRGKDPCPSCDGHGTALAAYVAQQLDEADLMNEQEALVRRVYEGQRLSRDAVEA